MSEEAWVREAAIERGRCSVAANGDGTIPEAEGDLYDRIVDTILDTLIYAYDAGVEVDQAWVRVADSTVDIA